MAPSTDVLPSVTFSLVIETENLGSVGVENLFAALESLEDQTRSPRDANEVLVVAAGHLSEASRAKLTERFPWLRLHEHGGVVDYADSKRLGASLVTGDVVVYADSDVRYEKTWLENVLDVFRTRPDATVAVGDARIEMTSAYALSLNLAWFLPMLPDIDEPTETTSFQFNNFAVRRKTMLEIPYPSNYPLYRGKSVQWIRRLVREGHKFYRAPNARGYHAPLENINWLYRMMSLGSDFVAKADYVRDDHGEFIERRSFVRRLAYFSVLVPARLFRIVERAYVIVREDPSTLRYFPAALPLAFAAAAATVVGGAITCFDREYVFRRLSALEASHTE